MEKTIRTGKEIYALRLMVALSDPKNWRNKQSKVDKEIYLKRAEEKRERKAARYS